ncbi:MAG: CBS domain-containing protein [Blastocatellia bacterium]|nr:CBS domain-containing protein [Blastocatellia bacterium]MBL8193293.1 CBS domain-containing protein [Blastocatellia bacterium]MBN8722150.1 CBS domain-containing protein [Acidobacteriota bacterium]
MRTVNQLLKQKPKEVYSVTPNTTVFDTLTLMAKKDIGAVIVMEDEKLVGIMSERDYARKIILKGKSSKETLVEEIMTSKISVIGLENTVEECMVLMTEKRIRHLPVIKDKKVLGLISIGDVVKDIIEEQQFLIKQLEMYIAS